MLQTRSKDSCPVVLPRWKNLHIQIILFASGNTNFISLFIWLIYDLLHNDTCLKKYVTFAGYATQPPGCQRTPTGESALAYCHGFLEFVYWSLTEQCLVFPPGHTVLSLPVQSWASLLSRPTRRRLRSKRARAFTFSFLFLFFFLHFFFNCLQDV